MGWGPFSRGAKKFFWGFHKQMCINYRRYSYKSIMKSLLWNLFLLGILLVSLAVGSATIAEPLSMGDLADYSPVIDTAGSSLKSEKEIASFNWAPSVMTPAPTTAVTTMPAWAAAAAAATTPVAAATTTPVAAATTTPVAAATTTPVAAATTTPVAAATTYPAPK